MKQYNSDNKSCIVNDINYNKIKKLILYEKL